MDKNIIRYSLKLTDSELSGIINTSRPTLLKKIDWVYDALLYKFNGDIEEAILSTLSQLCTKDFEQTPRNGLLTALLAAYAKKTGSLPTASINLDWQQILEVFSISPAKLTARVNFSA
ncbi:hypothetical protein [Vibrio sp. WXL103]|uniref:hypothetical protein n=1 Tax=unclassified Vibrio TaxID=2614977 RepID=UPI003EC583EE